MLMSNRYNFLYVHIAKTGGTSIRKSLSRLRWRDPLYIPQFICARLDHLTGHRIGAKFPRHAKAIAAQEMLPRELYSRLFKFAFVRNPWDLQVSSFHHIRRERPDALGGITDFKEFMRFKLDPQRPYQYHIDTSIELQSDYVKDLHGQVILDYIGRYERLQDDFNHIYARLKLRPEVLPHKRKATDRSDYRRYYDDATAELVATRFKADIDTFGYHFDNPGTDLT